MSEPTEFPRQGLDERQLARRRSARAILESILTKAGVELDRFEALHQESEADIQARIEQQMAEADAESAAMRDTVRREVENWRKTVEHLKTLAPTAAPVQRFLLDTASDITATSGLTVDSKQIAPTNNAAKFFFRTNGPGTTETLSFAFLWQNPSDRPAVVNVDGYLVLDGRCRATAFGNTFGGFNVCHMFVDARLDIHELWNQPPTSPIRQSGQDARALQVSANASDFFNDGEVVTRFLFRGFDLQYGQFVVPPHGTARIEVSCVVHCFVSNGQARFIFNNDDGRVLAPGVLIGVLP